MNKVTMMLAAMMLFLFGLSGCMKEPPVGPGGGSSTDQEAIQQLVQTDSLGEVTSSDENVINDGGPEADDFGMQKEAA